MFQKDKGVSIVVLSDLHCGNVLGLTPPKWNPRDEQFPKLVRYRDNTWDWFKKTIDSIGEVDICVVNGDAIDGKGSKRGGVEQIWCDRADQIQMAIDVIKEVKAKKFYFTYGTGYHVGTEDDWEKQIAAHFNGSIKDIQTLEINGAILKFRHHIGGSQSPVSRGSALYREQTWDALWSLDGEFEMADVYTFSHVHYFNQIRNRHSWMLQTPALQGLDGCPYGSRRLSGIVDFGFLLYKIDKDGNFRYEPYLLKQTKEVRGG